MSYQSDNLDLEILEVGDPADLTTVSDNFDKIDAVAGDMATVETSPTQAAHSVGEFLLYGGHLYKVTSAISAGGSLILGTNVQAANIGSELKSLRDSMSDFFTLAPWGVYRGVDTVITLAKPFNAYKWLIIRCGSSDGNITGGTSGYAPFVFHTGTFSVGEYLSIGYFNNTSIMAINLLLVDATHFKIVGTNNATVAMIRAIYGAN